MNNNKWPHIAIIALSIALLAGMILPWIVEPSNWQISLANVFNVLFDPTKWILLTGIAVNVFFAIAALITKSESLYRTSGIIGIFMCLIMLGTIGIVCFYLPQVIGFDSSTSSHSVQECFGDGLYMSVISILATLVVSIISLKVKK